MVTATVTCLSRGRARRRLTSACVVTALPRPEQTWPGHSSPCFPAAPGFLPTVRRGTTPQPGSAWGSPDCPRAALPLLRLCPPPGVRPPAFSPWKARVCLERPPCPGREDPPGVRSALADCSRRSCRCVRPGRPLPGDGLLADWKAAGSGALLARAKWVLKKKLIDESCSDF